jgi:hypothetical protein
MKMKLFEYLKDLSLMKNTIRTRGNISAAGQDELTNPIFKLEKDLSAKMDVEIKRRMLTLGEYKSI